mmetsp:Transcript_27053/g.90910  ORF Transcript_27053/g.90910 Transcript_27053/m.90910 type:complete len:264 (+) Transcript_27053:43-834(+)
MPARKGSAGRWPGGPAADGGGALKAFFAAGMGGGAFAGMGGGALGIGGGAPGMGGGAPGIGGGGLVEAGMGGGGLGGAAGASGMCGGAPGMGGGMGGGGLPADGGDGLGGGGGFGAAGLGGDSRGESVPASLGARARAGLASSSSVAGGWKVRAWVGACGASTQAATMPRAAAKTRLCFFFSLTKLRASWTRPSSAAPTPWARVGAAASQASMRRTCAEKSMAPKRSAWPRSERSAAPATKKPWPNCASSEHGPAAAPSPAAS